MHAFRRGAVVLALTFGMVLGSCTDVEVRDSHPISPRVTVGNRLDTGSRATSTTTAPDVQGALTALAHVIRVMFVTTTTVPPPPSAPVPVPAATPGAPTPISSQRCSGVVEAEIQRMFGPAAPWASSIAVRESNCRPDARNPSGSSGLFQLLLPMHNDLLSSVCPSVPPDVSWSDASCNIAAAYRLYLGAGTAPWAL